MAEDPKVVVQIRTKVGSSESRRLRRQGLVPANIYGHGEGSQAVAAAENTLGPIVDSGHKVIDVDIDGKTQKTMIRDVQWDTFGTQIQHVDLIRVSADEKVEVEVPVEFHGVAPGVAAGGVLEQLLHSVDVECTASQIPDSIVVNINELQLHQTTHVRDLQLPPGVKVQNPPEAGVVQVIEPVEVREEEVEEAAPTEPELVGEQEGAEEGAEQQSEES